LAVGCCPKNLVTPEKNDLSYWGELTPTARTPKRRTLFSFVHTVRCYTAWHQKSFFCKDLVSRNIMCIIVKHLRAVHVSTKKENAVSERPKVAITQEWIRKSWSRL